MKQRRDLPEKESTEPPSDYDPTSHGWTQAEGHHGPEEVSAGIHEKRKLLDVQQDELLGRLTALGVPPNFDLLRKPLAEAGVPLFGTDIEAVNTLIERCIALTEQEVAAIKGDGIDLHDEPRLKTLEGKGGELATYRSVLTENQRLLAKMRNALERARIKEEYQQLKASVQGSPPLHEQAGSKEWSEEAEIEEIVERICNIRSRKHTVEEKLSKLFQQGREIRRKAFVQLYLFPSRDAGKFDAYEARMVVTSLSEMSELLEEEIAALGALKNVKNAGKIRTRMAKRKIPELRKYDGELKKLMKKNKKRWEEVRKRHGYFGPYPERG